MDRRSFVGTVTASLAVATSTPGADDKKPRILIVAGPSAHPPGTHEVPAGARLMKHCLENITNTTPINADVIAKWPDDPSSLASYSSLVFIGDVFPPMKMPETSKILKDIGAMMDRGCGIVCVHYATGLTAKDVAEDATTPCCTGWVAILQRVASIIKASRGFSRNQRSRPQRRTTPSTGAGKNTPSTMSPTSTITLARMATSSRPM